MLNPAVGGDEKRSEQKRAVDFLGLINRSTYVDTHPGHAYENTPARVSLDRHAGDLGILSVRDCGTIIR
jgi:hypothetical protein